jgi:hypothetical protein
MKLYTVALTVVQVHPRVVTNLAAWCSASLMLKQTGSLVDTIKGGDNRRITKPWHRGYTIQYRGPLQCVTPFRRINLWCKRRDVMDTSGFLHTCLATECSIYVLRLVSTWGRNPRQARTHRQFHCVRMGHNREHPGCQILMIVTTGTHDASS